MEFRHGTYVGRLQKGLEGKTPKQGLTHCHVGPADLQVGLPSPYGPHLLACFVCRFPPPLRMHLSRCLSRFDPRAHVGPSGLYILAPAPSLSRDPKTLIHILLMRIRASYQEKIRPPQDLVFRNREMEIEGRVWRRCWPIGAFSTACTLAEVNLSSEISLVINF